MDEQQIFAEALELSDAAERQAFLDKACGHDSQLRERIARLLETVETNDRFMEQTPSLLAGGDEPPSGATATFQVQGEGANSPRTPRGTGQMLENSGEQIGPYTLLQKIGEGGMGTVYMAEQKEPVKRRVAIKAIKEGMDSRAVLTRFEAERHALSLMDHPNIARVLDAGCTDSGKPYFVMELVKGIPIHHYCDEHKLNTRQRLELFKPVCHAVQHAHMKGIVHRDIKPSNILVAEYDEHAVPKVIDFGVAKALHQPLTDQTLFTHFGQIIGTLEYMSPEQAKVNELDVDTRSDIYSLGIVLYEILTGTSPFDRKRLREAAWDELIRIIRDEQPQLPSKRLSSSQALPAIAASRNTTPSRLSSLVRGELDWIVMKALEKDRNRRYQTCTGFLEDIDRYLHNQPISACPPSRLYLVSKFIRRNTIFVVSTCLLFVALLMVIGSTTWGMFHADRARQAEHRKAEVERSAKEAAVQARLQAEAITAQKEAALVREQQQRRYAEAITQFVRDDFLALTSVEGQIRFGDAASFPLSKNSTLQQLLDRAAAKLDQRQDLEPRTLANLHWMIGVNYRGMGSYDLAQHHLQRSANLYAETLGAENQETLNAQNELAIAELKCGNHTQAIALFQSLLDIKRKLGQENDSQSLKALNNLAIALQENSEFEQATAMFEKISDRLSATLPEDNLERIHSISNLADCLRAAGRYKDALPMHQQVYELRRKLLPQTDPRLIHTLNNLAICYHQGSQFDKAIELYEEAVRRMEAVLEPGHPDILKTKNNLANGYQSTGKWLQARQLHQDIYDARKKLLGETDRLTLTSLSNLAESYRLIGDTKQALQLHEQALAGRRKILPPDHLELLDSLNNLAICYHIDGRYTRALALYDECFRLVSAKVPDRAHPAVLSISNNLALCHIELGKYREARKRLEEIVELRSAATPNHVDTFSSMCNLAKCQLLTGDVEQGLELLSETLQLSREHLPLDHPQTLEALAMLGRAECDLARYASGLPHLQYVSDRVEAHPTQWPVRDEVRKVLFKTDQHELLRAQLASDLQVAKKLFDSNQLQLASALAAIAKDMLQLDDFRQAQPLIDQCLQIHRAHDPHHPQAAAVQSLQAQGLIVQTTAGQVPDRAVAWRQAAKLLDASYRIEASAVAAEPTLDLLKQLQFTVEQLVEVTALLGPTTTHKQWQTVQQAVKEKISRFELGM